MHKAQSEYQDKYWNYQEGYKIDTDPYEELVLNTPQPYDFSASRAALEKKKRRKQTRGKYMRSNTSPRDNRMKREQKVSGEKCFVSSFSKKIEITPRVIIHQTGFQPESIQSSEFDDTSEIISGNNSNSKTSQN